jgi:hypothetical protein
MAAAGWVSCAIILLEKGDPRGGEIGDENIR